MERDQALFSVICDHCLEEFKSPGINRMHVSSTGELTQKDRAFECPHCSRFTLVAVEPEKPKNEPQPRSYNYGY